METFSVIDRLRSELRLYQRALIGCLVILAVSIVGVPAVLRSGPYVISDQGHFYQLARTKPWELTISRMEGFAKLYLSSRFEWNAENFTGKKAQLKSIMKEAVFNRFKDSLNSFEALAKSQSARSFYALEGFAFSNAKHVLEARVSRVLRIQTSGLVSPIVVRLSFEEVPVTESNPYGLQITGVEEVDAAAAASQATQRGGS
jgi:hypothetical protein